MTTLVFIECPDGSADNTAVLDANLAVIQAAKQIGRPIHALVLGREVIALARHVATIAAVDKVLYLDDEYYQHPLPERSATVMAQLAQSSTYSHLLAAATGVGKNIMPRVAALLDVMQVSEVTNIIDEKTFEHYIYAGRVIETVRANQDRQVLTVRTTHFAGDHQQQKAAEMVALSANNFSQTSATLSVCLSTDSGTDSGSNEETSDVSSAKVVVAGGGGLSSKDEFSTLLTPLAQQLGGAVGASRMPVANGFCSSDCLIGQTGKVVAPKLYIAVAISGANQHIAGMKDAKTIIAINRDEHAPIFHYADYGLAMDAREVLPALTEQLNKIQPDRS
ncbi:MAG: electron transfer flavoprotein subunit alpha [Gammaproteobacteria bacterium]|nr:MAG: electron transfer flavoprotein subunit alpha [Gammaproteobacteria bacterium]